jgi:uncharacterized membrane protein YbhN (UPF0104 family)
MLGFGRQPKEKKKQAWSAVFGTILGGTAFAVIVAWAGGKNLWHQLAATNLDHVMVYVALTIATYFLRAWRFALLIGLKGILSKLYGIVSVHTLMINLLPFSSGELSYPYLLQRCGISTRYLEGVPSILIARLQDLVISGSFLLSALLWVGLFSLVGQFVLESFKILIGFSLLVAGGGALLYRVFGKDSTRLGKFRVFMSEILASFANISVGVWFGTFMLSIAVRLTSIIGTFYLIEAVGISLSFPKVFLICSAYVFLPLLPINTVAGVGVIEAFLLTFLVGSGIEQRVAAAASIQIHFFQLIIAATLAVFGIGQLYLTRKHAQLFRLIARP